MKITSLKDIANAVRGRRLELRITQSELASQSDVSRKWLNQFEAGKAQVDASTLLRLLVALNLELAVDQPDVKPPLPRPTQPDLDRLLRGLTQT